MASNIPIPEPPNLVKAGLPGPIWTLIVGYLVQGAVVGMGMLVTRLGLHVPADVLQNVAQLEIALAVAVAGAALGSAGHAIAGGIHANAKATLAAQR